MIIMVIIMVMISTVRWTKTSAIKESSLTWSSLEHWCWCGRVQESGLLGLPPGEIALRVLLRSWVALPSEVVSYSVRDQWHKNKSARVFTFQLLNDIWFLYTDSTIADKSQHCCREFTHFGVLWRAQIMRWCIKSDKFHHLVTHSWARTRSSFHAFCLCHSPRCSCLWMFCKQQLPFPNMWIFHALQIHLILNDTC